MTAAFRLEELDVRGLNIPKGVVAADGYFRVEEDNQEISPSESYLQVAKIDEANAEVRTVIMLDNSFSVAPQLADIRAAAKEVVSNGVDQQVFAIYSFSGSPVLLQDFTDDIADLHAAIDSIAIGQPTTNLNGSIIEGLSRWADDYSATQFTRGFLVLLTDGSDQTGINSQEDVLAALGNKRIFTIGLGDEIDRLALAEIGNAGNYEIAAGDELANIFDGIQEEISNDINSFYWLNYISPKRGANDHLLEVAIVGNPNIRSNSILRLNFNSNGFSDVTPEVVLNRGVFTPSGIQEVNFSSSEPLELRADTLLGFVASDYAWQVADPAVAKIVEVADERILLEPLSEGATTLTVTDLANDEIVAGFFFKTIPVTVGSAGVPGLNLAPWAAGFGLAGDDALATSDPNADGINNLLAYALGIHPLLGLASSPGASLPDAGIVQPGGVQRAQITFNIPSPTPAQITYVVEQNCSLGEDDWLELARGSSTTAWFGVAPVTEGAPSGGYQRISVNSTETVLTTPMCLLRVRVVGD